MRAQNIILQYIQEKVIAKIPDTDTYLHEILNCIKRIHARNKLIVNKKDKQTRQFCLDHGNCECTLRIAQMCHQNHSRLQCQKESIEFVLPPTVSETKF